MDRLDKMAEAMVAGGAELKASQAKTDEQLNKTIRKLEDIGRQLGDLGLVQGEVADEGGARDESA